MARYKKYRHGGKKVPGMYAQDGVETTPAAQQMKNVFPKADTSGLTTQQIQMMKLQAMREKQKMQAQMYQQQQQQQVQDVIQQMKLQNDSLIEQNDLLKTQIEKSDLINSARTTKQPAGATNSPKKRGGTVRPKISRFISGNAGNIMKHGGSCLPGGRGSKRRR